MTEQRFNSVTDLLRDATDDEHLINEVALKIAESQLVKHLTAHRVRNNLSQKDVATRMGCTQSRISKLEAGKDKELRLGDLEQYLTSLDLQLRLVVAPRSHKAVDEIKFHAFCIKQLLLKLVKLASTDDPNVADGIAQFACVEAPISLLKIVLDAAKHLPEQVLDRLPTMMIDDVSQADDMEGDCDEHDAHDNLAAT